MGESANARPSKRRRVLTEAKDESARPNVPDLTVTRESLRKKPQAKTNGDLAPETNGVERKAPARSSAKNSSATRRTTGIKDSNNADGAVNGTSAGPVRSSGRLKNREEKGEDARPAERSASRRNDKAVATAAPKTSAGDSELNSRDSKTTRLKPGRKGDEDKPTRNAPTRNRVHEENSHDGFQNNVVNGLATAKNLETEALWDDHGGPDAATQLQQELNGIDRPTGQSDELPQYAEELKRLCEEEEMRSTIDALGRLVLEKLCGKRRVPLRGLDSEYDTVHHLLEQTVVAGEGNSMLLLGARGCGKTSAVETSISVLARDHQEDFHVVRLNGFLHTDDRVALREIWHQLGREVGTEDDLNKVSSYADTMATLLALLSHPEELFGPSGDGNAIKTTKSVIIILDEFDLFVSHPRQTLLYNLFDIAQAKKAPLAVLGLTTKVDVTENLEKRVKSRFSHRYVFLPRPRNFSQFSDICLAGLKVEDSELDQDGVPGGHREDTEDVLKTQQGKDLIARWNAYLQGLWEESGFQTVLQRIFHQTRCPRDFFTSALAPLYSIFLRADAQGIKVPKPASFSSEIFACPDPPSLPFHVPTQTSTSTTSLPLSLLLTATRLTALHEPSLNNSQSRSSGALTLSFAAVYAEYVRLLTTAKVSASASGAAATPGRIWSKDLARESWEKLADWGLIVPVGTGSGMGDARAFRVEISFEEVVDCMGEAGTGAVGRWWKNT